MSAADTSLTDAEGNRFNLRLIHCPICGPAPVRSLGRRGGEHHRYGLGVDTLIVRCVRCGLLFPNPFPFPAEPQKLYGDPDKYFEGHDEAAKVQGYRAVIGEMANRLGRTRFSLLDVGSGRGELLAAARLEGLTEVMGLDFAEAMIAHAAQRFGVTVLAESIEAHSGTGRTYDAIALAAVLEHVHDPDSMVAAAARMSLPGALLYIDVPAEPNLMTWVAHLANRLKGSPAVLNLSPTFPPFHVYGFNRRSLSTLLVKHGYQIASCHIWANPVVPAGRRFTDRTLSYLATQVNRVANATGTAHNMIVWARRC